MTAELSPSMTLSVTHTPTMSSLEIAEITGKRHADVLRDIRVMLDDLEIGLSKFASSYVNEQNKEQPCYRLPKDLMITLVSGYRADLRLRIVRRWMELEEANKVTAPALPNFNDPVLAARAWADEVEKKRIAEAAQKEAEQKLIAAQPTIAAGEQVEKYRRTVSDAARKFIGVNSNTMKQSLGKADYLYKNAVGTWRVYSKYRNTHFIERFNESGKAEIYVTAKGIQTIAQLYKEGRLIMLKGFERTTV